MSTQITHPVLRIPVYPDQFGDDMKTVGGSTPKMAKGAGVRFEFGFFVDEVTVKDVSKLTSVTMVIRTGTAAGAVLLNQTVTDIVKGALTLAQWADTEAPKYHVRFDFPSSITAIVAGEHFLCLFGVDADDPADIYVFGKTKLTVVDCGSLTPTSPVPGDDPIATIPQVSGMLGNYLPRVLSAGESWAQTSDDGKWRRWHKLVNHPLDGLIEQTWDEEIAT
jgi:hypothetical protein